jgi:hypothetical protein
MERSVRGGQVRYTTRYRGLSAFIFVGSLPWAVAGWMSRDPVFYGVAGLFLLGAFALQIPVRVLAIDRAADTLRLVARSWRRPAEREVVALSQLRGVRAVLHGERVAVYLDLPGTRSIGLPCQGDPRTFARRLAEDLGCAFEPGGR